MIEHGEIWVDIIGYEKLYRISNFGRVQRLSRVVKCGILNNPERIVNNIIMKNGRSKSGYSTIILVKDSVVSGFRVHRLVAQAFIPNTNNKLYVNHINGIKTDNQVENLEWCTQSENQKHAYKIGLQIPSNMYEGILQLNINGSLIREWKSTVEIERQLGIKRKNISNCINGMSKLSSGFMWKIKNTLSCQQV